MNGMKVLIVSDTHGNHFNLDRILDQAGAVDMFIHLGDVEGGEEYLDAVVDCEKHMVKGNKIFITHGHGYYVSLDPEYIKEEGKARNADIVMFGHTHRPYLDQGKEITVLNPGSVSYPRQEGRKGSYMIMELNENEKPCFHQYYLD